MVSLTSVVKNGPNNFTLKVASAESQPEAQHNIKCQSAEAKLTVQYGDFSTALEKAASALKEVNATIRNAITNVTKPLFYRLGPDVYR
jgi:dipeptidyl-peptidase-3